MSRSLFLALCLVAAMSPLPVGARAAGELDTLLAFGDTYAKTNRSIIVMPIEIGDSLLVYGSVTDVSARLENAIGDPGLELTFVIRDLALVEGYRFQPGLCHGELLYFEGGYFRLYADASPDLNSRSPDTYADGILLLEGPILDYRVRSGAEYWCEPNGHVGHVDWNGGSLLPEVMYGDTAPAGNIRLYEQSALWDEDYWIDEGYLPWRLDGMMTLIVPVRSGTTTWGELKTRFLSTHGRPYGPSRGYSRQ